MPKFVIYEVWTRSRVVTARSESEALTKGEPDKHPFIVDASGRTNQYGTMEVDPKEDLDLNLANWHAQRAD